MTEAATAAPEAAATETATAPQAAEPTTGQAPANEAAPAAEPAKEPEAPAAEPEPAKEPEQPRAKESKPKKTILEQDEPEGAEKPEEKQEDAPVPAAWPDDWRDKLAKGDDKLLKELNRYTSLENYFKSTRALKQMVHSGEYIKALGEDATPEEVAEYRKKIGVPEDVKGYFDALPEGLKVSEADRPMMEQYYEQALAANMKPAQANAAIGWYYQQMEAVARQQEEADAAFHDEAENELRSEWGQDYAKNRNMVKNLLAGAPEGLAARLLNSRTPEGRKFADDPDSIRFLAQLAREINPAAAYVSSAGANQGKDVTQRINELTAMSGDRGSEYWKGPNALALQEELGALLEYQAKQQQRGNA